MKFFLKPWLINSLTLVVLSQLLIGFKIYNDFKGVVIAGLGLTFINIFIKPLLKIITLPFNLLTLGIFSWLVNVFSFGLLFLFVQDVSINPFYFPNIQFGGIIINSFTVSRLGSLILATLLLSLIKKIIEYIVD